MRVFSSIKNRIDGLLSMIPGIRRQRQGGQFPHGRRCYRLGSDGYLCGDASRIFSDANGSKPVIANSSEFIANRAQTAVLASALGNRGGSSSLILNGGINISGAQAQNPKAVARAVMAEIEREWQRFSQSKLAPNY